MQRDIVTVLRLCARNASIRCAIYLALLLPLITCCFGADLWSLQTIQNPAPPNVQNSALGRTPIDNFVLARLEAVGLTLNAEADRRTLIRRLTFDLLGLPPTPGEIDAFLADRSTDAY